MITPAVLITHSFASSLTLHRPNRTIDQQISYLKGRYGGP